MRRWIQISLRCLVGGFAATTSTVALAQFGGIGQQTTNITVSVDGTVSAPGTYLTADVFLATCEGTESTIATAGDPAILKLQWTPQSNDTIFWDTAADCNTGNTVTNDAGGLISGNDTSGPITPLPSEGSTTYGVGAGNVSIDLRQVLSDAFATVFSGVQFDGGSAVPGGPCSPPEGPTPSIYVCVTQTTFSGVTFGGSAQTTLAWYMPINYDTNPPSAPSGVVGQSGDQNITVGWSYSDPNLIADHFVVYYQPDPGASLQGSDGACTAGVAASRRSLWAPRVSGDGGCPLSDQDTLGNCCGDAGVNADGGGGCLSIADAGSGDNTPAICGGCFHDSDCTQSAFSSCLADSLGNTYCAPPCVPDAGTVSPSCPAGFLCKPATDLDGFSAVLCLPPDDTCRPAATSCGACTLGSSQCGPGALCVPSVDGGSTFCAVACSDGGVNGNGTVGCLGDTSCSPVSDGVHSGTLCAPRTAVCFDPTPLAQILDGGDAFTVMADAGLDGGTDAGSGGSGIDVSGWGQQSFGASVSSGQIGGLTNGVCYDFVVQTVLPDGTQGAVSSEVILAPIENFDFWRLYQRNGGGDQGGFHCQSGGGTVAVLAALAALLGLRRRRVSGAAPGADGPEA